MHRLLLNSITLILALAIITCSTENKIDLEVVNVNLENGEMIYLDDCVLCHEGAIEGAHRLDQTDRWQESANKGFDQLVYNTVHGYQGKYGELPVMGMCSQCSDQDIQDAVAYMLVKAGFVE